ncbi:hypothetical protein PQR02_39515 [Paraburkholderia sediminicola]|uniref:Uncharacterized protein n=1 Tax=Paraburkholderia rhynchosiae TaxID=487049 RepID=A0ACC7NTB9_9BURK
MKAVSVLLALLVVCAPNARADGAAPPAGASEATPKPGALVPADTGRGKQVNLDGENLPVIATVELCEDIDDKCARPHAVFTEESTSKSVKFFVPPTLTPGSYRVRLTADRKTYFYSTSELVVRRAAPVITTLSKSALYPEGKDTYAALQIYGTGFARSAGTPAAISEQPAEENVIRVDGVPLSNCDPDKSRYCAPRLSVSGTETTITVEGLPQALSGKVKLDVQVANVVSNPVTLLMSPFGRWTPRTFALGVLAVVLGISYFGNRKQVDVPSTPTERIRGWRTIFVDFDSNTYSLSRLQLVIWTFVALFGWVYLSVARSLIQGMATFSDIPNGLPGVLLISVGTSVAAGGVAAVKGGKSAGPFSPSFRDFYSVGGIVAPERAQFFLWTIVGAVGFIVYTLALDPATIETLPKLPEGFLQLAGISAAGYVGGKIVRKTGPVLTDVKAEFSTVKNEATWTLTGTGLAKNATFSFKVGDGTQEPTEKPLVGATAEADSADQDGDATLFKKLTVKMVNAPKEAFAPAAPPAPASAGAAGSAGQPTFHRHLFVIINPDGQRAEWPY